MHNTRLKGFVFEILFIGDHSSTFYLFLWQSLKCTMFIASKLEHFENDIRFCQDIQHTITLNDSLKKAKIYCSAQHYKISTGVRCLFVILFSLSCRNCHILSFLSLKFFKLNSNIFNQTCRRTPFDAQETN